MPKPNPKHLALRIIGGATFAGASFFTTMLPAFRTNPLTPELRTVRSLTLLVPLALGLMLWGLAYRQLKRGHDAEVWSESELAPVRSLVSRRYWTWLFLSLFAVALVVVSFTSYGAVFIYITMLPMNALSGISRILKPPSEPIATVITDYRDAKPLRSDHWGEAPRSHDAVPS